MGTGRSHHLNQSAHDLGRIAADGLVLAVDEPDRHASVDVYDQLPTSQIEPKRTGLPPRSPGERMHAGEQLTFDRATYLAKAIHAHLHYRQSVLPRKAGGR